jgi:hypothetical protein
MNWYLIFGALAGIVGVGVLAFSFAVFAELIGWLPRNDPDYYE